jgi:hypothetical protein
VASPLLELGVNEDALEVELAETPPQEARLASKTLERRNNAGFFMMNKSFRSPYKVGEGIFCWYFLKENPRRPSEGQTAV